MLTRKRCVLIEISVQTLKKTDLDIASEIARAAFETPYNQKADLHRFLALQPDGWWLASRDGIPVGLAGLIDHGPFAYVGMVSVLPSVQRHGVGKALMRHLLAWSDARGCPTVLLDATPSGAPLYAQFDFVEDTKTLRWERHT